MNPDTPTPAMPPVEADTALVVFAARDFWSSLQSISWCMASGRLDTLFIYQTAETHADADRLRRLCSRQWPTLKVVLPGEPGTDLSAKVIERLRAWRRFRPNLTRWILDCTAAEPPMLAAVSRAGDEFPDWIILRRQPDGEWQGLASASGGRLNPEHLEDAPQSQQADAIGLPFLLPSLYADTEAEIDVQWRLSRAPEKLTCEQMAAIAGAGREANWEWHQMFEEGLKQPAPVSEWGFNDFIGAALALLGVDNTRINLPVRLGTKRPCEQIFDVVAVHDGALWLFDCQPRLDTDTPAEFDLRLWQLPGAHRIVVRSGRRATIAERLLTDDQTMFLDSDDCRRLFSRLGALLGLNVPPALRAIERDTLALRADSLPVFSSSSAAQQFTDAIRLDERIYDLQRGACADAGSSQPPWLAARVADDLWFIGGSLPQPAPPEELRQRLDDRLAKSRLDASVVFYEVTQNRMHWYALVRMREEGDQLGRWLSRWRNVPLIT
ncbi:MAG: hypothetical protein GX174_04485 [Lentisphaerae bacterium]|nr:hypothetical protein [Lentisphaerota bacterium]